MSVSICFCFGIFISILAMLIIPKNVELETAVIWLLRGGCCHVDIH